MDDIRSALEYVIDPPGTSIHVQEGWSMAMTLCGRSRDAPSPQMQTRLGVLPQFSSLRVSNPDGHEALLLVSLHGVEASVRIAGILDPNDQLDLEAVLAWVKAIRPLEWWRGKALIELVRMTQGPERAAGLEVAPPLQPPTDTENVVGVRTYRRLSPGLMQQVADIYTRALEAGGNPTAEVARQLGISRSTAGRWVMLARRPPYNLLPPADSTRPRARLVGTNEGSQENNPTGGERQ